MKKKHSFLKSGIVWSIILMIVGIALASKGNTLGGALLFFAVVLFVITVIRRIHRRIWKKPNQPVTQEPAKQSEPAERATPVADTGLQSETHIVAGVNHHKKEVVSIGIENDDYSLTSAELREEYEPGDRIFEYTFSAKPALVFEPDNPHDPNAIRVEADGVHIGYIKSGSTPHVRKLLESERIISMELDIYGGRFKYLEEDDDDDYESESKVVVRRETHDYAARLTLRVKPE